jgi:hypothetical protein
MVVDDSWSDHQAIRIQRLTRISAHFSDLGNTAPANRDITVEARQAGTVDNIAIFDNQVVCHCSSSAAGWHRSHFLTAADRLRAWPLYWDEGIR